MLACSQQVSDALRSKQMNIAQLASLSVIENEQGANFIAMPATGGLQEFSVDSITTATTEVSAEFLPEELIAF